MKNPRVGIPLLSFILCLSSAWSASAYLSFDDFPDTAFGCEFEFKETVDRIESTGVKILRKSFTQSKKTSTCSFSIQIELDSKTVITDTYRYLSLSYGYGWYETLSECEKDLESQVNKFQIFTGLEPFIGYCSSNGSKYNTLKYWPRVVAFGKPDLELKSQTLSLPSKWTIDFEPIVAQIKNRLDHDDKRLAFVRPSKGSILIAYYSASRSYLTTDDIARFESQEDCKEALKSIEPTYQKFASKVFSLQCAYSESEKTRGLHGSSYLFGISLGGSPLYISPLSRVYKTKTDCQSQLTKDTEYLKSIGEEPLAIFCASPNGKYYPYFASLDLEE